jgi:hypothetical protein
MKHLNVPGDAPSCLAQAGRVQKKEGGRWKWTKGVAGELFLAFYPGESPSGT